MQLGLKRFWEEEIKPCWIGRDRVRVEGANFKAEIRISIREGEEWKLEITQEIKAVDAEAFIAELQRIVKVNEDNFTSKR